MEFRHAAALALVGWALIYPLGYLPEHLRPVALVVYHTGWRRNEVLSREWRHVDFEAGRLRLDPGETKNNEGRMVALVGELREVLEPPRARHLAIERATEPRRIIPWVFIRDDGSRIVDLRYSWAKACRRAGVPGRMVHDLRRTAVRNMERAGVSRSTAMKMSGHQTESIYRRYAIVAESDLRDGAEKLAAFHARKSASAGRS